MNDSRREYRYTPAFPCQVLVVGCRVLRYEREQKNGPPGLRLPKQSSQRASLSLHKVTKLFRLLSFQRPTLVPQQSRLTRAT